MYADFQEKILTEIFWKKFQTFHCSNVTTVKPRFWNTSWSAANVFQNRGLFQNRGPHFGKRNCKMPLVALFILFLCHNFFWVV